MGIGLLAGLLLAFGPWSAAADSEAPGQTPTFRPKITYQGQNLRDPFVEPGGSQKQAGLGQVAIASLKLTGIIRNPTSATALFTTQTGPEFGYLLRDGSLYAENHRLVAGITGRILNPKEVLLRQDGREIVFKLR